MRIENNNLIVYSGSEAAKLSQKTIFYFAKQAHRLLFLYPKTMLINTPGEIANFIKDGRAVLLVNKNKSEELIAYARLHLWPGFNQRNQRLFEFRSWVVKPNYLHQGFGAYILCQTIALGRGLDLNSQIVAVVEKSSQRALKILQVAGGKILNKEEWPKNLKIVLQEGKAKVNVLDVTRINNFLESVKGSVVQMKFSKRRKKNILLSVGRIANKKYLFPFIKELFETGGFKFYATEKTHKFLKERGIPTKMLFKISQERSFPNIRDFIEEKYLDLVINIPTNRSLKKEITDGRIIRRLAVENEIPLITEVTVAEDLIKKLVREYK